MAKSSHRIRVRAPPDRVYQALTTKDGLQGWYTSHLDGDVHEGGEVKLSFSGREPFRWRQIQHEPGKLVRWECLDGPGAAAGTTVTYALMDAGSGQTVVACEHDGWPEGHEHIAACNTLWGMLMGRLRDFSETGKADPMFR